MKRNHLGFTLIELLLVIGIIMILAALVIVSVSKARSTGRDGKRTADLSSIQLALEMYKDSKGNYSLTPALPTTFTYLKSDAHTTGIYDLYNADSGLSTAFNKFLAPIPQDPIKVTGTNYGYMIMGTTPAGGYYLAAPMEDATNIPAGAKLGNTCYCIYGGTANTLPAAPTQCN